MASLSNHERLRSSFDRLRTSGMGCVKTIAFRNEFRGWCRRLAARPCVVAACEIVEDDAPGHTIDREVVNRDEQASVALRSAVEQPRSNQWTVCDVERGLYFRA